jgi:hypothetical protein
MLRPLRIHANESVIRRPTMTEPSKSDFAEGDRVSAISRPGFPSGTVLKLMDQGFVLVRWDGDVLETAHHRELTKADE